MKGKKTYASAGIALLYLIGTWAGFWEYDEKVLGAIGFTSVMALRDGIASANKPSTIPDSAS